VVAKLFFSVLVAPHHVALEFIRYILVMLWAEILLYTPN